MKSPLQTWIETLIDDPRYGTKRAIAKAAGLTESALWRQVATGKLGVLPLLRLALDTGELPSVVLERAGKGELARAIEACYGPARAVSPHVATVLEVLTEFPQLAPIKAQELREIQRALRALTTSGNGPPGSVPVASRTRTRRRVQGR
jgi:hypothetical protein